MTSSLSSSYRTYLLVEKVMQESHRLKQEEDVRAKFVRVTD